MTEEDRNKDLKKLFKEFGWVSTDLNNFVDKANKKTIIDEK